MYYLFVENGKINGAGEVESPDKDTINCKVSKTVYLSYIEEPLKFIYANGKITENPEYETIKQKEYIEKQIAEIQEKLDVLDKKRIRAVCEDEVRDERTGETWLDYYNEQVYDLRIELKSLEAQI